MNKHLIIGAAVAGLVLAFAVKKTAATAARAVGDAVNPLNSDNIFSQGANGLYQFMFDSTGTMGSDLFDFKESVVEGVTKAGAAVAKATDPTRDTNLAYGAANGAWRAVGVLDEHETIGTKAYETVESIENWLKGMF